MATESKEKIIRVLQIMKTTDEKSPLNAKQIIEKLDIDYTIEIERRSIYRDIRMLQYCGYDIKQCKDKRKGWYLANHAFDDWEIKLMMDAVQQAKCVTIHEATVIRDKLIKLSSNRGQKRFSHMIRIKSGNVEENQNIGIYIERMLEAIYSRKKIKFQYTEITNEMEKVLRKDGKEYIINLYTIYWSNNNYYLIGAHDHHDGLTHYRLDRIINLKNTEYDAIDAKEKIDSNLDPERYIQEYIEKSVNHFTGECVRIEVEYKPDLVTNKILYDFVGKDINVKKQKNGMYVAEFSKMNSVALTAWFLQYVNIFKVISPETLKKDIIKEVKSAIEKYSIS